MMKINIRKYISLLLKIVVIFFATSGILIAVNADKTAYMGGINMFMYFTIQSNILIALICLIGVYFLFSKNKIPIWWQVVKYVGTVAITLTGFVFCFILAPSMGKIAWNIVNLFTHVIVPISAILDFFVFGIKFDMKKKSVLYTVIPPILYLIFASICFVLNIEFAPGKNYPYFFLNWKNELGAFGFSSKLPYIGCAWWIIFLLFFVVMVGLLYLFIINMLKKIENRV